MTETYLGTFRSYLRTRTDAPEEFHLHAGLCTLAVALGARCWVDGPAREIYPNLNSVVLAPSGMGKSVALDMAVNLLHKAGLGEHVLPSSFSQEALLEHLAKQPVGLFVVQEFSAFMALLGRDYNRGAEQTLTELYDVPPVFVRELKTGTHRLYRPCLTIMGASSPEWFADAFKGSALRGGWLARFLFCPSRSAGEPIGDPGPRDEGLEASLALHLRDLVDLKGHFDITPISGLYDEFSKRCRLEARQSSEFGGIRSRGPLMALKVAMLFHVSRDPETLVIEPEDFENAVKFVQRTHVMTEHFLSHEVPRNHKDADRLRVLEIVDNQGGQSSWSTALRNSHLDAQELRAAVATLVEAGLLEVDTQGRHKVLRRVTPLSESFAEKVANVANVGEFWHRNGVERSQNSQTVRSHLEPILR